MPIDRVRSVAGYVWSPPQSGSNADFLWQRRLRALRQAASAKRNYLGYIRRRDDFDRQTFGTNPWLVTNTGTSTTVLISASGGIAQFTAVGAANDSTRIDYNGIAVADQGASPKVEARCRVLQTAQTIQRFGLAVLTLAGDNSVYVEADDSQSANWFGVVDRAGTKTRVNLGFAATANQWRVFLFDVDFDLGTVNFYASEANALITTWRAVVSVLPNGPMQPAMTLITRDGSSVQAESDFYEYWARRNSGGESYRLEQEGTTSDVLLEDGNYLILEHG